MIERIRKWLAPPVFEGDDEKTRVARLLNLILIIVTALVMFFSVPALFITPAIGRVIIELALLVLAIVMLLLMRRGYVYQVGYIFTFGLWFMISFGTYAASGFSGSTMSSYFGIILIAGLLLGSWAAAIFGALSIVATGLMLYLEANGQMPPLPSYATLANLWVEFSVTVIGVIGLLALAMNSLHRALITSRRSQNELAEKVLEVQDLMQRAQEASEFKSQLIARISHELRTPLGAIVGLAEMLQAGANGPLNPEQTQTAERIVENVHYFERIIGELLTQSQIDMGALAIRRDPFSPYRLKDHVESVFRLQAERRRLELNIEVDPNLPEQLCCDPERVEQILSNLVGNAIKFTPIGGITIRIYKYDSDYWAMQVADTGIGIPQPEQKVIFDTFRQGDESSSRSFGGVGLGLSIVQSLTHAMKGRIFLESESGEGSVFTVILPIDLDAIMEQNPSVVTEEVGA